MRQAWLPALALLLAGAAPPQARVPFVGCPGDGQVGPMPAPRSGTTPRVASAAAARLAFYSSGELGVLAPRGWHCLALIGSNGTTLLVTPASYSFARIMDDRGISGPAVQLSVSLAGTSGRFEVVELIGRAFPAYRPWARRMVNFMHVGEVPAGPYQADRLVRRSATEVAFTTPGGRHGLGTQNRFAPGADPVRGLIILTPESAHDDGEALKLDVRLPGRLADLAPVIVEAVHRERGAPRTPER